MKRNHLVILVAITVLALVGGTVFAQDLKIEYQIDVTGTARSNYLTFAGPIRYMAVEQDHFDGGTGASSKGSTEKFQPYRYDVLGKNALADGFRGLLLFGVAGNSYITGDNVTVSKASNGVITIQYAHRGTAYRLETDRNGRLQFPNGTYQKRSIGYIQGAGPQVISRDFSSNGNADGIDWNKVWSSSVAGGKAIPGSSSTTGNIVNDGASDESMYYWQGALQVTFERNVLKITGGLNAVKR